METALKLLEEYKKANTSLINTYKEKLAFAEFSNNQEHVKIYESFLKVQTKKDMQLSKAIEELKSIKVAA